MNTVPGEVAAIAALELGNWRTARRILSEGELTDAYIGADLRTVARAMSYRAAGEHGRAWTTLGIAAASVHRRQPALPVLPAKGLDVVRLALPPDPGEQAGAAFRTVRLIWREQGELSRLRRQAAESPIGLTQDRHILLLAFIEYLCWVECDRESWLQETPPDDDSASVEARIDEFRERRRDGFLRSATDLRRLQRPTAGGMTRAVWDRADQYFGLRRMAMEELARRLPPPWGESATPAGTPRRKGAQLAWMMAQTD
ncbi:hypothetical protein AB0E63_32360 [Kribbella sp. NPDC026596]|uniref:hypothetical protein n=1 Tax=Kribbella sp. NPDC026596 TaxID=3155122 RepID=UPI003404AB4F